MVFYSLTFKTEPFRMCNIRLSTSNLDWKVGTRKFRFLDVFSERTEVLHVAQKYYKWFFSFYTCKKEMNMIVMVQFSNI